MNINTVLRVNYLIGFTHTQHVMIIIIYIVTYYYYIYFLHLILNLLLLPPHHHGDVYPLLLHPVLLWR